MKNIQVKRFRSEGCVMPAGRCSRDEIRKDCWECWEGTQSGRPDLCVRRNQRALHLAVSKPLQQNNKLWMLFDRHLFQIETGQQMHAQRNWGDPVEPGGTNRE